MDDGSGGWRDGRWPEELMGCWWMGATYCRLDDGLMTGLPMFSED
jgi:hypothetical protein